DLNDLNDVLFDPNSQGAVAINNLGQILLPSGGIAYLLTPGAEPLTITTTTLPDATSGQAYTAPLGALGGNGIGYTWSLSSGSLPLGFTLSPAGVLSSTGSPAAPPDSYSFTVQV